MPDYYLIRRKSDGKYFGWEDTDICLAPMDKFAWYDNPHMQGTGEHWLAKYKTPEEARADLERFDFVNKKSLGESEVVEITTSIKPV